MHKTVLWVDKATTEFYNEHMSITKGGEYSMPRPHKCRRVCRMPSNAQFHCSDVVGDKINIVNLTVEEFETIRLIDYGDMTQEECAKQMDVARTTVQRIYADARKSIATFLIEGTKLQIMGGSYELCGKEDCKGHRRCSGCNCQTKLGEIKK